MAQRQTDPHLYAMTPSAALSHLSTSQEGLDAASVRDRQKKFGKNVLRPKRRSLLKQLIEPFASLFVSILVLAMAISLFSHEKVDAVVIGVVLILNAGIYYVQQYSASKVLKSLKQQDITGVHVKRHGEILEVMPQDLVPGDIVYLQEGLKVPADGRVLESGSLQLDEAILTGESLPVAKITEAIADKTEIYDQKNMVFMGSIVHSGSGVVLVSAIGSQTEIGSISELLGGADLGRSPIERKIDQLTKQFAIIIGVVGVLVFGLALVRGISAPEALRFSLALIVSVVPEGLPVALTVVLLLSAKKLAKSKALIKNTASIETLGAVTLIATDKTGTLTKNKLTVAAQYTKGNDRQKLKQAVLASLNGEAELRADPLDAILAGYFKDHSLKGWKKVKEYPFNQELRMSGVLWTTDTGRQVLYVKGAPETIRSLAKQSDPEEAQALGHYVQEGYRTICIAHTELKATPLELETSSLKDLKIDGLLGLADELRDGIGDSIKAAREAGIKVVMLTGDHVDTARNIAKQVGLVTENTQVAEAGLLEGPTTQTLLARISHITAFGRVLPKHKFNFLQVVKGQEITAMTGDGVNDIPALAEADAGLAMGSGTDAAKTASDIVLLDDNFNTIIEAIRIGRSVVANIRKMLFYVISTSIGEAMTMVGALILGLPLPVTAVQVLWINLVTDGFTVLPLGLSAPEQHQMQRPPKSPKAPILSNWYLGRMIITGLAMSAITLILFSRARLQGYLYAQTVAFIALVVGQWANSLNANFDRHYWIRNFTRPNKPLFVGIAISVAFQVIALYGPFAGAFHSASISTADLLGAILIPLVVVLAIGDLHKLATRKLNLA